MQGSTRWLGVVSALISACASRPEPAKQPDAYELEPELRLEPVTARSSSAPTTRLAPDTESLPEDDVPPLDTLGAATPEAEQDSAPELSAKPLGATVKETRTMQVIQKVVLRNRQSVRNCYEREQKQQPRLSGSIKIRFKIDPKGNVSTAEVNSEGTSLLAPSLQTCALQAIGAIKFPPSSRGFETTVNYPFDFRP